MFLSLFIVGSFSCLCLTLWSLDFSLLMFDHFYCSLQYFHQSFEFLLNPVLGQYFYLIQMFLEYFDFDLLG